MVVAETVNVADNDLRALFPSCASHGHRAAAAHRGCTQPIELITQICKVMLQTHNNCQLKLRAKETPSLMASRCDVM